MATRRMFSQRVTNSARFLKMTASAQNLYFHLCMRADDDGVVEAYTVMQMLSASEDDLRCLVGRKFVQVINADFVSIILDWKEHNLIRADRKVDSIYKELLLKVLPDIKILESKERADTGKKTGANKAMAVQWTSIGPHRLGKVRIGKNKDSNLSNQAQDKEQYIIPPTEDMVTSYCAKRNNGIIAKAFIDWYEARGWKYKGGLKVVDWQAAVRTWENKNKKATNNNGDEARRLGLA